MLDSFPLIMSINQQLVKDRFFPCVSEGSDSVLLTALSHVWRIFLPSVHQQGSKCYMFIFVFNKIKYTCIFLSSAFWLIGNVELSCYGVDMLLRV